VGGAIQAMPIGYFVAIALSNYHYHRQISSLDLDDREACKRFFKASTAYGLCVFLAIIFGKFLKP